MNDEPMFLQIKIAAPGQGAFVKANGVDLPVTKIEITATANDLPVVKLTKPFYDPKKVTIETIEGYLVDQNAFDQFVAWKKKQIELRRLLAGIEAHP